MMQSGTSSPATSTRRTPRRMSGEGGSSARGRGGGRGGRDGRGRKDGRGAQGHSGQERPGDWNCPSCKTHNFKSRAECFKCRKRNPSGAGGGQQESEESRYVSYLLRKDNEIALREIRRIHNARKFLTGVAKFFDGADLLWYLERNMCAGAAVLRNAIRCLDQVSDAEFAELIVSVLARFGKDDVCVSASAMQIQSVFDKLYQMSGFVGRLTSIITSDCVSSAADLNAVGLFVMRVAVHREDARSDPNLKALAEELIRHEAPLAKRLQVLFMMFDGTAADAKAAAAALSGKNLALEDIAGGRHDNDKADYRAIAVLPTVEEVHCIEPPFLPPLQSTQTPKRIQGDSTRAEALMLERQFRLLREDFVGPLRQAIINSEHELRTGKRKHHGPLVFGNVCVEGIIAKPKACLLVSVSLPAGHRAHKLKKKEQKNYWESSSGRRTLGIESLVGIMIEGRLASLAVVARHETKEMMNRYFKPGEDKGPGKPRPIVGLEFLGSNGTEALVNNWLPRIGKSDSCQDVVLVQACSSLFAYTPVVGRLRFMTEVPLADELVHGVASPVEDNFYLNHVNAEKEINHHERLDGFKYDESQRAAMRHSLQSRVSLTQGPPGTGKSHLGERLIEIICRCTTERILVVCFTNHALDDILSGLLKLGVTSIVRLGGGCKRQDVEPYCIQHSKIGTPAFGRRYGRIMGEIREVEDDIENLSQMLEKAEGESNWFMRVMKFLRDNNMLQAVRQLSAQSLQPEDDDKSWEIVDEKGKPIKKDYLWKRWIKGRDAGVLQAKVAKYKPVHGSLKIVSCDDIGYWGQIYDGVGIAETGLLFIIVPGLAETGDGDAGENKRVSFKAVDAGGKFLCAAIDAAKGSRLVMLDDAEIVDPRRATFIHEKSIFKPGFSSFRALYTSGNQSDETLYICEDWPYLKMDFVDEHGSGASFSIERCQDLWEMSKKERNTLLQSWKFEMLEPQRLECAEAMKTHARLKEYLQQLKRSNWTHQMREKRVIGCTTTAAAMYADVLKDAGCTVVVIEEAGEVLEAHVLSSLQHGTKQLIMIGDHQQLRPKLENYELEVASGRGHDLNCSLFERLVKSKFPYSQLKTQHRMRPEISDVIRMTYPDLINGPHTTLEHRPHIRGVDHDVVFIDHDKYEDAVNDTGEGSKTKTNSHEAQLVVAIVRYLLQQGYNHDQVVVLTPYIGQVQEINRRLRDANLNALISEMDQEEIDDHSDNDVAESSLSTAAAASPSAAQHKAVRVATVDNFQGEEADIIVISLVRANPNGSIGFLVEPERVNVLMSRARCGELIVGHRKTLEDCRKQSGRDLWRNVFEKLEQNGSVLQGLPVRCDLHRRKPHEVLSTPELFDMYAANGGCDLPCNTLMACGHACPLRCHPVDRKHVSVQCTVEVRDYCAQGHLLLRTCASTGTLLCKTCRKIMDLERKAEQEIKKLMRRMQKAEESAETARKAHSLEIKELQEKMMIKENHRAEVQASLTRQLEIKRLQHQSEIQEQNSDANNSALAAEQVTAAEEKMKEYEKQERKKVDNRVREATAKLKKLELDRLQSNKQLTLSQKKLDKHLVDILRQREAAEKKMKAAQDKEQQLAAKQRVNTERDMQLNERLRNLILRGSSCNEIRLLLLEFNEDQLKRSLSTFISSNGEMVQRVMRATLCDVNTNDSDNNAERARGLQLMSNQKWLEASDVLALDESAVGKLLFLISKNNSMSLDNLKDTSVTSNATTNVGVLQHLVHAQFLAHTDSIACFANALAVCAACPILGCSQLRKVVGNIGLALLSDHIAVVGPSFATSPPPLSLEHQTTARNEKFLRQAGDSIALQELVVMIGLTPVKEKFFDIKGLVCLAKEKGEDLKKKQYNTMFTGNPGTGKTTVARLYARFLKELKVLPNDTFEDTSGSKLIAGGTAQLQKHLGNLSNGGVLFVDKAYQLSPKKNAMGGQVLDLLLTEMEDRRGTLVVVFAGYKKPMEDLLEHNEGLPSRFRYFFDFPDFTDQELVNVFDGVNKGNKPRSYCAEDKHVRIAMRRIGRGRGTRGFGNARAVRNFFEAVLERQTKRVLVEREGGQYPDTFGLVREDLLGPRELKLDSLAVQELNALHGLDNVKEMVRNLIDIVKTNHELEEEEKPLRELSLNRVFLGNPGTGKTSVARIYGQILKDLGMLSKGEVILKNPSDFIGSVLGESEKTTNAILEASVGCVLVIDEAYGLNPSFSRGLSSRDDPYKTAVIDTLVARVQGVPGDDRCVLLLGYEEEMTEFIRNANPGLQRRFQLENAFFFQDYDDAALLKILGMKLKKAGLAAGFESQRAAIKLLARERMKKNFGNAGAVDNLIGHAMQQQQARLKAEGLSLKEVSLNNELLAADFAPPADDEATVRRANPEGIFDDIIGCEDVLKELRSIQRVLKREQKKGNTDPLSKLQLNFIFAGPPGTGKTTVARRVGMMFEALGVLANGDVTQCSVSNFSTGYVGQAKHMARKMFEKALGGVLFIDEAYRFAEDSFSHEAVNEIVNLLTEEQFQNKMVVVFAGYEKDINEMLKINEGLSSRIGKTLHFAPFDAESASELLSLYIKKETDMVLCKDVTEKAIQDIMQTLVDAPGWASGRDVDRLFNQLYSRSCNDDGDARPISLDLLRSIAREMVEGMEKRAAEVIPNDVSIPRTASATHDDAHCAPVISLTPDNTNRDDCVMEEVEEEAKHDSDGAIVSALKEACVQLGYDENHSRRQEVKAKLENALESSLQACAPDIVEFVCKKTGATVVKIEQVLRLQIPATVEFFVAAIRFEEERLAALALLEEMEREREKEKQRKLQKQLRGMCPMGFAWHREGNGWRCNGGSHWIPDGDARLNQN